MGRGPDFGVHGIGIEIVTEMVVVCIYLKPTRATMRLVMDRPAAAKIIIRKAVKVYKHKHKYKNINKLLKMSEGGRGDGSDRLKKQPLMNAKTYKLNRIEKDPGHVCRITFLNSERSPHSSQVRVYPLFDLRLVSKSRVDLQPG